MMSDQGHVLFIQKRGVRAGAQTSLARLACSGTLKPFQIAVLVGDNGWLARRLRECSVPTVVIPFPSPRAFWTRLNGGRVFAYQARRRLTDDAVRPGMIIANDHQECPLAVALATSLGGIPVVGILRSAGMSRRDFDKYACVRCDRLMTVGAELTARVRSWTSKPLSVFQEGFCDEEFHPPLPWSNEFPQNILIMGSEAPGKGFTDFIQALDQVEMRYPDFPALNCDFTGATPVNAEKLLGAPRRSRFRFLGRVDGFSQLVRGYRLAVHPSRAETFGMAPIEGILAGVPVLVSETGAVSGLGIPSAWSFPPARPDLLAERLAGLWRHWETSRFEFGKLQERIRQSYHIDLTASSLRQTLASLEGKA